VRHCALLHVRRRDGFSPRWICGDALRSKNDLQKPMHRAAEHATERDFRELEARSKRARCAVERPARKNVSHYL
jgi:hypothetical protein